jgi:site-specific recombinase XerD
MEQASEKLWSLLRAPEGPLVPHIDAFANELNRQGFRRRAIAPQIRLVAKFSHWLKANHIRLENVSDEGAERFLRRLKRRRSIACGSFAALRRLMAFLRQSGVLSEQSSVVELTAIQRVVGTFADHLIQDQALTHATCIQYGPFIEQFLTDRFGDDSVDLSALCAADVVRFVRQQASRLGQARAKCATIALRSFLRYLRYRGEIALDLAAAVPTVPNWSMTGIPRAIAPDHVRAVLASCQRDSPVGCRDYAILLLLARLGLRAGEIVALTLDSIDWEAGCLTAAGKGGQSSQLPLPADVGAAIADYLQRYRPRGTSCRTLFLRANAPIRGLGSHTSIDSIVHAAIKRAGVETTHKGAHQFRHALACQMLRQGATLTEIGNLLRHRHPKTTSIYAKVDFVALRPLSLPWPGGA